VICDACVANLDPGVVESFPQLCVVRSFLLPEGAVDFVVEAKDVVVVLMHVVSSHDLLGVELYTAFLCCTAWAL
jgi:hypothetical protein